MKDNRETGRLQLLGQLIDDQVLSKIRERLTPEQIALLIIEAVNPHRELNMAERAKRDGVTERTIRNRS